MDTIKIKDKIKGIIEMEVVLSYKTNSKNYVIYKDCADTLYIAEYNYENDKLNSNLTEEEIKFGEKMLKEVQKNVKN